MYKDLFGKCYVLHKPITLANLEHVHKYSRL